MQNFFKGRVGDGRGQKRCIMADDEMVDFRLTVVIVY